MLIDNRPMPVPLITPEDCAILIENNRFNLPAPEERNVDKR